MHKLPYIIPRLLIRENSKKPNLLKFDTTFLDRDHKCNINTNKDIKIPKDTYEQSKQSYKNLLRLINSHESFNGLQIRILFP